MSDKLQLVAVVIRRKPQQAIVGQVVSRGD